MQGVHGIKGRSCPLVSSRNYGGVVPFNPCSGSNGCALLSWTHANIRRRIDKWRVSLNRTVTSSRLHERASVFAVCLLNHASLLAKVAIICVLQKKAHVDVFYLKSHQRLRNPAIIRQSASSGVSIDTYILDGLRCSTRVRALQQQQWPHAYIPAGHHTCQRPVP